jgi:hypothetical protein
MAIKSSTFGRVTLTESDAKKFKNQITYGKPKLAAIESVKRGVALSRTMRDRGKVTVTLKRGGARTAN